jgi:hypothetical protein
MFSGNRDSSFEFQTFHPHCISDVNSARKNRRHGSTFLGKYASIRRQCLLLNDEIVLESILLKARTKSVAVDYKL